MRTTGVRSPDTMRMRGASARSISISAAVATRRSMPASTASDSSSAAMQHQPARALRDPLAQHQDRETQHRADPERRAPPPIRRQQSRLQQHDRADRPERRADPEAAVDREVGAAAIARRDQLLDRRVDRRVLAADPGPGQRPEQREAPEIPGERRRRGGDEVHPERHHEQLAAAEAIGQIAEQQCARRPRRRDRRSRPARFRPR